MRTGFFVLLREMVSVNPAQQLHCRHGIRSFLDERYTMSFRTFQLNNTLSADPEKIRHRVIKQNRRKSNHEIELSPELRFPGDIPNPMIPHRAHSRSGSSPLSHYERISLGKARYQADDTDNGE